MTDKPLNIGIVCYPTPGGSGVMATELGMTLAERGNNVHFITSGHPARLSHFDEHLYLHKVETGDYPLFQQFTPYSLSLAVKIREVAVQYSLDLVHVHYAIPHAASAYLAKQMMGEQGLRTLTTLHGTDITLVGMMPSFYEITRFSIDVSDGITAVSKFLRDETVEQLTNGKEAVSGEEANIREGVVIRPTEERRELELGRVILKSVSEKYLLRKNATEFN